MLVPKLTALNVMGEHWGKNEDDFWVTVQAEIAVEDVGSEVFTFSVVSPVRLDLINKSNPIIIGRSLLIMSDFNINEVKGTIEKLLMGIKGGTWDEITAQVSRYARSEYE